jgi:transposase
VRVSTAFNKMLAIPGAWVASVSFFPEGIVVGLRRRARRLRCPCGYSTPNRYDASVRRWRHLDLGSCRLFLEAEVRRIDCPTCGVRTEDVAWARPRARHTRDFEDVVAWLAQRTDKTTVARLLRCSWEGVDAIVTRVVADHLDARRLEDLYRIGVDEVTYRRGNNYITLVVNHDTGGVVWGAEGKSSDALLSFFDELGPERCAKLEAISLDFGRAFRLAARIGAPNARECLDPFHVVSLANKALDAVYKATARELGLSAAEWRRVRTALRTAAERLTDRQQAVVARLRRLRHRIFRAWDLKEALRDLYRIVDPRDARAYLKRWITSARRSKLRPFGVLADTIQRNFEGIVAAVELGLSNSIVEGVNGRVRLIQRRGYGYRSAASLIAMVHLCCGALRVSLPMER